MSFWNILGRIVLNCSWRPSSQNDNHPCWKLLQHALWSKQEFNCVKHVATHCNTCNAVMLRTKLRDFQIKCSSFTCLKEMRRIKIRTKSLNEQFSTRCYFCFNKTKCKLQFVKTMLFFLSSFCYVHSKSIGIVLNFYRQSKLHLDIMLFVVNIEPVLLFIAVHDHWRTETVYAEHVTVRAIKIAASRHFWPDGGISGLVTEAGTCWHFRCYGE